MQSPFAFDGMIVFGWLSFMLLAGVLLRATIPLLQRFLFPSCLVGGVLGLALTQIGIIQIDTLAFQTALLGLVYIFTYGLIKSAGIFLPADAAKILWGFFFIIGMMVAIFIRRLMTRWGWGHLIDPGVQRRVTGWAIDFLIVATVAAIQLAVVWRFILPIGVLGLVNGILTTLLIVYLGRRLSAYNLERTAAVYGAVTGTVSSGLLLLRIADPEFKTPVAIEIAIMNVFSIIPIGICLMLVNGPVWWGWGVGLTSLVFLGIMILCLMLLKVLKYLGPPKF